MIVYDTMNKGPSGVHNLQVTPAAMDKTVGPDQWRDPEGKPETILVSFRRGVAKVDDALGRFLIHHKLARKNRPLIAA